MTAHQRLDLFSAKLLKTNFEILDNADKDVKYLVPDQVSAVRRRRVAFDNDLPLAASVDIGVQISFVWNGKACKSNKAALAFSYEHMGLGKASIVIGVDADFEDAVALLAGYLSADDRDHIAFKRYVDCVRSTLTDALNDMRALCGADVAPNLGYVA